MTLEMSFVTTLASYGHLMIQGTFWSLQYHNCNFCRGHSDTGHFHATCAVVWMSGSELSCLMLLDDNVMPAKERFEGKWGSKEICQSIWIQLHDRTACQARHDGIHPSAKTQKQDTRHNMLKTMRLCILWTLGNWNFAQCGVSRNKPKRISTIECTAGGKLSFDV